MTATLATAKSDEASVRRVTTPRFLAEQPTWATTLLAASAMLLLLDLFRVMLPSLALVYASIGSESPVDLSGLAVAVFIASALMAAAAGTHARFSAGLLATATVATRIGLVAFRTPDMQLLLSTVGFVVAVGLLGALAASNLSIRHIGRGLALAFVAQSTLDAILRSQDSLWYGGAIAWLVALAVALALVVGFLGSTPRLERPEVRTVFPWLIVGPLVGVHGIVAGTPAILRYAWGEGPEWTGALLVAAHVVGYVAGRAITTTFLRDSMGVLTLGFAALTGVLTMASQPGIAAVAVVFVAILTTMALVVAAEASDDVLASRNRRSIAVGSGMIVLVVVGLGYYYGYDTAVAFPQAIFPAAGALLVGLILMGQDPRPDEDAGMSFEDVSSLAFAPFIALLVLLASTTSVPAPRADASLDDVRILTYNIHYGFNDAGEFDPDTIAAVIRSENPDVVVLNEVDRGWMLTGGHDALESLSNRLGMQHLFAPSADLVWGNAVLSRLPLVDPVLTPLPNEDPAVIGRSALSVTVDLGDGDLLGLVATQFSNYRDEEVSREGQARIVAELARDFELRNMPVAIVGDLNAAYTDPEMAPLRDFVDAAALAGGGVPPLTYPSRAPERQSDHILVSHGFVATDLAVVGGSASDHFAVAVTLGRASPPTSSG